MRSDIRYAFKAVAGNRGFAIGVVLLLAAGIGTTTTMFSIVDGVLLRSLPYPDPSRLVYFDSPSHSPADFEDWQHEIESIAVWGGMWNEEADLTGDGPPLRLGVVKVTPDLFEVLGARATLGRLFAPDEHRVDPGVAVISHSFWQGRYGSDPELLGRDIRLGGRSLRVVGILAPGFEPPEQMLRRSAEVWVPLDPRDPAIQDRGFHVLEVIGRLANGASIGQARTEMDAMDHRLAELYPESHVNEDGTIDTVPVIPLKEALVGDIGGALFMLLGAVGLLLLLTCANVANLLLARGAEREREMAIRGALGATPRNLLLQLASESALLALAGGVLGVVFAFGGVRLFELVEPGILPRSAGVGVDGHVLLFAVAVAIGTGVLFGVIPALQAARTDMNSGLKDASTQTTVGERRNRLQGMLVVAEVALSMVLLAGAGILFHSFLRLTSVDTGFRADRLVTVDLQLLAGYDAEKREAFTDQLVRRLRAVPETRAVVAAVTLPFQYSSGGSCCWRTSVWRAGIEDVDVRTAVNPVWAGYFSALEIPLVAGRDLEPADDHVTPTPVVVNSRFATTLFGRTDAVGEEIEFPHHRARIVGVVGDVRHTAFDRDATPELYMPWTAAGSEMPFLNIAMRTDLEPGAVAPAIRAAIWDLDPDLPIPDIATMKTRMRRSVADERFYSAILVSFAAIALLLAAAGVYATLQYSVRRRVREMGIRLALGAQRVDVVRLVLRRGLGLTALGIAIGMAATLAGSRVLNSMVFGISVRDPATLTAVSALLMAVALCACLLPAVRASRTDPIRILREE